MKTIIIILAFLFSFSYLQAQVKSIDFVMPDGTRKQIPIEEIETVSFDSLPSNLILEVYLNNNTKRRYVPYAIDKIRFVDSFGEKKILFFPMVELFDAQLVDTLLVKNIDSINFVKKPIGVHIKISKLNLIMHNYSESFSGINHVFTESSTFTSVLQDISNFVEPVYIKTKMFILSRSELFCNDTNLYFGNIYSYTTYEDSQYHASTTTTYGFEEELNIDTANRIINEFQYSYEDSDVRRQNSFYDEHAKGKLLILRNVPYRILSNNVFEASIEENEIDKKLIYDDYEYRKDVDGPYTSIDGYKVKTIIPNGKIIITLTFVY